MHGKYLRLKQHDNTILTLIEQAEYAHIRIHVHNASFMIVFRRFHRYRISVYRKQAGNSETMTSDPRGRHGTAPSGLIHEGNPSIAFTCSTAIIASPY